MVILIAEFNSCTRREVPKIRSRIYNCVKERKEKETMEDGIIQEEVIEGESFRSYFLNTSNDEDDDLFGKIWFCTLKIEDLIMYLLSAGRLDEREKLDAFSSLRFSTRCPCCFELFKFRVDRGLKEESKQLYLSVMEPTGTFHIVMKYVDQPINLNTICSFDQVDID